MRLQNERISAINIRHGNVKRGQPIIVNVELKLFERYAFENSYF